MGNKPYRQRAEALHRGRLAEANRPNDPMGHYNGAGEAEVVAGYELARVLQKWTIWFLDGRNKTETAGGGVRWQEMQRFEGPVQWLAHATGINVRTVGRICNGKFTTVSLSHADKLLQAIERPDLLGTVVRIVPNPNWSMEKWLAYMADRGCIE